MGCAVSVPNTFVKGEGVEGLEGAKKQSGGNQIEEIHVVADGTDYTDRLTDLPGSNRPQFRQMNSSSSSSASSAKKFSQRVSFDRRKASPPKINGRPKGEDNPAVKRERRVGYGTEGVRDQIKKMAIGGQTTDHDFYAVSSSESEASEDERQWEAQSAYQGPGTIILDANPLEHFDLIAEALERSFVFKGIDKRRLAEVINSMVLVTVNAGQTVIHQGALPSHNDCMYLLASGEVDIVIAGGGNNATARASPNEVRMIEGNTVRIHKHPGWLFGDIALLFLSQRSASIVTTTDATLWALDRHSFSKFVSNHAPGARALRFVRKIPLLKGLSDNALLDVATRMSEESFQDGQALIRIGEKGVKLFLIRRGQVWVQIPQIEHRDAEPKTIAVLGRGHFVGERTLVTGKLRTADCIAKGRVEAVVMSKRDFQDLDNPLLEWMIDYDAVATVLKSLPLFKSMPAEELEAIFDNFERVEHKKGNTICTQGQKTSQFAILRMGDLSVSGRGTKPLKEVGGFAYLGDEPFNDAKVNSGTVTAKSEKVVLLIVLHSTIQEIMTRFQPLGHPATDPDANHVATSALRRCQILSGLNDAELKALASAMTVETFQAGDLVVPVSSTDNRLYFIARGSVLSTTVALKVIPGTSKIALAQLTGEILDAGTVESQAALVSATKRSTSLVAQSEQTQVFILTRKAAERCLACPLTKLLAREGSTIQRARADLDSQSTLKNIEFDDLVLGRIIGAGQFGLVRVVQNKHTDEVYALKVMHKSTLSEVKQVEHVVNERRILGAANHPFCVKLLRALQDNSELYLLQEWVGGGELFHYLDIEGSFTDSTARFYTANVLLALQNLHAKGIVYRDLKPENLLVDRDGYVKVADFGFAKIIGKDKTYTICGTPDYQAPEIIVRKGTGVEADFWALGVLIFEMLVGDPPFKSLSGDPWDTFRRTLSGRFFVPGNISSAAADLIYKLLQVDPEKRLGSGSLGAEEIRSHHWFTGFDWEGMEQRKMRAPLLPRLKDKMDTSNFEVFEESDLPVRLPGRTDRFADQWDKLWDWVDRP